MKTFSKNKTGKEQDMDFKQIFERQSDRVYRLAYIYLKNAPDAEDAVQNIFVKYISRPVDFESDSHENAWFITVTRNYCKDFFRSFWRKNVDLGDIPDRASAQDEDNIMEYIMRLPEKYRELLFLYYYEEYSIKEIGKIINRKESTIQTQLSDGRKKLKEMLEKEGRYNG